MISAVSSAGDPSLMDEAVSHYEAAAIKGYPHAHSVLGFLYGTGQAKEKSSAKAFLYHSFASQGGNTHSKLALAYTYFQQKNYEKAAKLYAEVAEAVVEDTWSFLTPKDVGTEFVRIYCGNEENKKDLSKSQGEDSEHFQIEMSEAQIGNERAMAKVGFSYYLGLRGVRCDRHKALSWFLKAAEKGERRSMELLGEIYVRGAVVERNYSKALEWLTLASKQQSFSAYNGIGYLYVKGYGVGKNYTKAKEYFEKAAETHEGGGHYNLGVLYLEGIGVKKNVRYASSLFVNAANAGEPKALFQLAKMFHTGIQFKKKLETWY
ncbi:hypothetical protein AQUCO_09100054v1 [Aquilegia coerulea]|uniref:DOD-type homing endonuclease domain-containing protein n=1 Tax=Aquilegia coerulea TaxID=218851 RepID=A0A2G5C5R5_AQUCA|nr:hypothetical protein AQUCO_09100054v1 [Aquilegia coerulea]